MRKVLLFAVIIFHFNTALYSQELNAKVTVLSGQITTQVDKKVFQTLQTQLTNFLNQRKWTNETWQPKERIMCNFLLNMERVVDANIYQATLTIQAARPVYNTNYTSPLVNFQDGDVVFKYIEYQPVEFNENRVTGTDPMASNLTAVLAYYVYLIMGIDHDSFAPRGGDPFFQKMQNIVNNSSEGRSISGWKQFDGIRNRYWLMENLINNRYSLIHDIYYTYYRAGLDQMYDKEAQARNEIMNSLNMMSQLNKDFPNLMITQFFFQGGRADELVGIFKKAPPQDKVRAREILQKVDITNANKYMDELR